MTTANNVGDLSGKNSVPSGILGGFFIYSVHDDEGICYADPNVLDLFGCNNVDELRELSSNSFIGMVHPDDRDRVTTTIKEYNSDRRMPHNYIRYRIITKQGTFRYVEDFGHLMNGADGKTYCYVFISGLEEFEYDSPEHFIFDSSKHYSSGINIDSLTGLQNMDALYLCAKEQFANEASACRSTYTAIVFDILGLRNVNRAIGHAEGDERIRNLAEKVQDNMPEECKVYRGHEADIIAVCKGCGEHDLMKNINAVIKSCKSPILFGISSAKTSDLTDDNSDSNAILRALDNAQLDLRLKKMLNTDSNRSQALTSLIRALEEVDSDTMSHVSRTMRTGIALGRRIGLSDLELSMLQLLCLLHDIGKIAVPLEILNKPGKLTDAEWAVLHAHPQKGYQIASANEELKPLAEPILYHHERWDGKGYPKGLKGEEIPVLSRIISIVDAYDAMVNDRCYRLAMSPGQAKKEISDNAGTQFDPRLATMFLMLLDEKPALSFGSKTGGSEIRGFSPLVFQSSGVGATKPVAFSKYKLNLDNIIIEVDDFFETLTGYSRDDVVEKMSQFDLIPEEEREFYIEQVQRQFTTGHVALLQHPIKRKNGTVINVTCCGERYFDSSVRTFRSNITVFETT